MSRRRRGFTLIELIASAVLSAMMSVALLGVVWSAVQETSTLRREEADRWPATGLIKQMRQDLMNARGMTATPRSIRLHGFLGQSEPGSTETLREATVLYESVEANGRLLLTRRSQLPDGSRRRPVWYGFGSFRVDALEEVSAEDALLPTPATGGLPPLPGRFRITVTGDRGQRLWREVIIHHVH